MLNSSIQPTHLWLDAIVLLLYFSSIVGIGLWAGRRNNTLTEFALGGRSIPWWAVLASIIAAETSAATFLGTPAEGFKTRSFIYAQLTIGTIRGSLETKSTLVSCSLILGFRNQRQLQLTARPGLPRGGILQNDVDVLPRRAMSALLLKSSSASSTPMCRHRS